jgi:hypothetical protein
MFLISTCLSESNFHASQFTHSFSLAMLSAEGDTPSMVSLTFIGTSARIEKRGVLPFAPEFPETEALISL